MLEERVAALIEGQASSGSMTARAESLPTPTASEESHFQQDAEPGHCNEYPSTAFISDSPGFIKHSATSIDYFGNAHWLAILKGIPGLGDALETIPGRSQTEKGSNGRRTPEKAELLLPTFKIPEREAILDAIPPKATADRILAECFTQTSHEPMIVHVPTFHKEYAAFWEEPSSASTIWMGLLFALLCLGVQYQQYSPNRFREPETVETPEELSLKYRQKTIECLLLGKYTDAPPYALETVMLHLFSDFISGDSTETVNGLWVLWGTIVQIALRSGYHRDGSHFPDSLTPFQMETRRRIWAIMVEWDMYISVSFGLPRTITLAQSDTADPRNLRDEDLDVDMLELPPARPDTEYTRAQYHMDMNRLMSVLAMISEATSRTSSPPMSEILRLDRLLSTTYKSVSARWQQPLEACDTVQLTFLTLVFHRAQITLHRKYLRLGREHALYRYSRKVCIEAGLAILKHQWTLYLQTRVGGPLCRHGWKLLTPLMSDFMVATAILCAELALDLDLGSDGPAANDANCSGNNNAEAGRTTITYANGAADADGDVQDRVFHALSAAYTVWLFADGTEASREVKTIVAALNHVLAKAQNAGFGTWKKPSSAAAAPTDSQRSSGYSAAPNIPCTPTFKAHEQQWGPRPYFSIGDFPI